MSETMVAAIIGVIGTLVVTMIGALLGYFLAQKASKTERDRNDRRQAESTKAILSLEIDRNMDSLRELWTLVNQVAIQGNDSQEREIKLARRLIELPAPTWKRDALNSQLSLLAMALDRQEIIQVFQFYDRLSKMEALRNGLATTAQEDEEDRRAAVKVGYGFIKFNSKALSCWDECESLVTQLISNGNPLRPKQAK